MSEHMCLSSLQKVCWFKCMARESSEAVNTEEHAMMTTNRRQHLTPLLIFAPSLPLTPPFLSTHTCN